MKLAAFLSTLLALSPAYADTTREGFVVGGGLGLGVASLTPPVGDTETKVGLATDITIGYGLSPQLVVHLMSRIVWYSLDDGITFSETAGAGATYFLKDTSPSVFVTGGLGASLVVQPSGDSDNQVGFGALVGGGYELSPHWMVEANVAFGVPGDFDRSITAMAKVAYLHY